MRVRPFITTAMVTITIIVTAGGAMVAGFVAGKHHHDAKKPRALSLGVFLCLKVGAAERQNLITVCELPHIKNSAGAQVCRYGMPIPKQGVPFRRTVGIALGAVPFYVNRLRNRPKFVRCNALIVAHIGSENSRSRENIGVVASFSSVSSVAKV